MGPKNIYRLEKAFATALCRWSVGGWSVGGTGGRGRWSLDAGRLLPDDADDGRARGGGVGCGRCRFVARLRVPRAGRLQRALDDRRHQPRHPRHQHLRTGKHYGLTHRGFFTSLSTEVISETLFPASLLACRPTEKTNLNTRTNIRYVKKAMRTQIGQKPRLKHTQKSKTTPSTA